MVTHSVGVGQQGSGFGADRVEAHVPGFGVAAHPLLAHRSRRRPATAAASRRARNAKLRSYQPPPMPRRWPPRIEADQRHDHQRHRLRLAMPMPRSTSGSGMPKRLVTSGSPGRQGAKRRRLSCVQHRQAVDRGRAAGAVASCAGRFRHPSPSNRRHSRWRARTERSRRCASDRRRRCAAAAAGDAALGAAAQSRRRSA